MAFRIFAPILAGATLRDRVTACLGAILGISITAAICGLALGYGYDVPFIIAPMGASAVLLFAVPASPLAQPWPIIGGNTISAAIGLSAAHLINDPVIASGLAVGCAIAVMSLARCLHPPGGAAALTAALGGPAVMSAGWLFPLSPVALNSLVLVALGLGFHKLAKRSYPHAVPKVTNTHNTNDTPPQARVGFSSQDVDAALTKLDEAFDIDRSDLERLLREVEHQSLLRSNRSLLCSDIMSRDVVTIGPSASIAQATAMLLDHNIRTLPVIGPDGALLGTVGLRELATANGSVGSVLTPAATAHPDSQAFALSRVLIDGRTHAVLIVDGDRISGIVTQTDLLAASVGFRRGLRSNQDASSFDYSI